MSTLEAAAVAWIGDGRTIEVMAADDITVVARAVLHRLWEDRPSLKTTDEDTAVAQLTAVAKVAGFDDPARFLGKAILHSNGDMTLTIERKNEHE